MTRIGFAVPLAAILAASTGAQAFDSDNDTGWGAPYNSHLDAYSGRPLGPPLATLPPGYQYYNGRLIWVPHSAGPLYAPSTAPRRAAPPARPRTSQRR